MIVIDTHVLVWVDQDRMLGKKSRAFFDPADRLIAATALVHGAGLMTADEKLLAWHHPLERYDARL